MEATVTMDTAAARSRTRPSIMETSRLSGEERHRGRQRRERDVARTAESMGRRDMIMLRISPGRELIRSISC